MITLGVDPGRDGGLVVLDNEGLVIDHMVMPIIAKRVVWGEVAELARDNNVTLAVVERQQTHPRDGRVGAFNLGRNYEGFFAVFAVMRIPVMVVRPQAWKALVLRGTAKDKEAAIQWCLRRHPALTWKKSDRCRKYHDGLCDACCIAEYGRIVDGNDN
jgi:hypothetical protein